MRKSSYATTEALATVVTERRKEGLLLDFKEELDLKNKWEILQDLTSFANTEGGTLILGAREARDSKNNKLGYLESVLGINAKEHEVRQAIEHAIRDCTQPRLPMVQIDSVPGFENGSALIISVPKSTGGPHLVCMDKKMSCHYRNNHGKYPLDATQLREAFRSSHTLGERMEAFISERIDRHSGGQRPVPISGEPSWWIHLLPEASLLSEVNLDPGRVAKERAHLVTPPGYHTHLFPSLDGLVIQGGQDGSGPFTDSFTVVFRNGIIEGVSNKLTTKTTGNEVGLKDSEVIFIPTQLLLQQTVEYVFKCLQLLQALDMHPPVLLTATAWMAKRAYLAESFAVGLGQGNMLGNNVVRLPIVSIEEFLPSKAEVANALYPIFEVLAQAGGHWRSRYYDENGQCNLPFS